MGVSFGLEVLLAQTASLTFSSIWWSVVKGLTGRKRGIIFIVSRETSPRSFIKASGLTMVRLSAGSCSRAVK